MLFNKHIIKNKKISQFGVFAKGKTWSINCNFESNLLLVYRDEDLKIARSARFFFIFWKIITKQAFNLKEL